MRRFLSIVALCLGLAACLQAPEETLLLKPEGVEMAFTASFAGADAPTRTVLQEDGKVFWSPKESIHVFSGTADGQFTSTNAEVAASASFSGTMPQGASHPFLAVYPYDASDVCDGTTVTLTVPAAQKAAAGTFADGMSPAVARTEGSVSPDGDLDLYFRNVCSGLKFSLAHSDITAVTFRGNAGEDVAGKVRVGWDDASVPGVTQVLEGGKEIRLTLGEDAEFPAGPWFYLTLLPQTFTRGFTLVFETPTMTGTRVFDAQTVFSRSVWKKAEKVDEPVVFSFPDLASAAVDFTAENAHGVALTPVANDECTLALSGSDPYVYTQTLTADLDPALTVVEFEYKLTHPVDVFQLFFVLQGVTSEGASCKYGSLAATDRYKVFRADISAMRDGGWGKAGDFFRFDPGPNGSGTMHVRNFVVREMTENLVLLAAEDYRNRKSRKGSYPGMRSRKWPCPGA